MRGADDGAWRGSLGGVLRPWVIVSTDREDGEIRCRQLLPDRRVVRLRSRERIGPSSFTREGETGDRADAGPLPASRADDAGGVRPMDSVAWQPACPSWRALPASCDFEVST